MIKKAACLFLVAISSLTIAQPTLVTEMKGGDTWASFAAYQSDIDMTLTHEPTDQEAKSDIDSDQTELAFLAARNLGSFTFLSGFSVGKETTDDESTSTYDLSAGLLIKTQDGRTMAPGITLAGSSDNNESRHSALFGIKVQTSAPESNIHNEVRVGYEVYASTDSFSGGDELSLSNSLKLNIHPNADVMLLASLSVISDFEYDDGDNLSPGPTYSLGGGLNIHLAPELTAVVMIATNFSEGTFKMADGTEFDVELDGTLTSLSLMGRF